jgi:hypothetical protein
VADGEHASVEAMQTPALQSPRDRAPVEPELQQLVPADDAVLPGRKIGESAVWGCQCTHTVH